jgi:tRNA threonylcarbamoyladenosine modification (KEOPS) complex  Pcc1 subunit
LGTRAERSHSMQGRMTLAFEWVALFIYESVTYEVCTVYERTHSFWMLDDVHLLGIRIEKKMAIS